MEYHRSHEHGQRAPAFRRQSALPAALGFVIFLAAALILGVTVQVPVYTTLTGIPLGTAPLGLSAGSYVIALQPDGQALPVHEGQRVRLLGAAAGPVEARIDDLSTGISTQDLRRVYGVTATDDGPARWTVAAARWRGAAAAFPGPASAMTIAVPIGSQSVGGYVIENGKPTSGSRTDG